MATNSDNPETAEVLTGLQRQGWWHWWAGIVVTLGLTLAVVSLALYALLKEEDPFFRFNLSQVVRGLVGLVLLFDIYVLYEQWRVKSLRRQLADEQMRVEMYQRMALFDPLTGLYNRRIAQQRLPEEVARSQRTSSPLSVLLLDLNGFKQINDQYGHLAGDLVLREFANRLRKSIRFSDIPVRMGGDEFLLLLPDCRSEQVQHVLERMSPLEADLQGKKVSVTFSAGCVCHQSGELPEQLLERADQALYAQKCIYKQDSVERERGTETS